MINKIPLSDIDLGEEEIESVNKVLKSKWLSMGIATKEFEKAGNEINNLFGGEKE